MRTLADDHRSGITRRAVLQAAGLALASRFTSIAGALFDWLSFEWLMRMYQTDRGLRFA